jgi:hypothetical protein
MVSQNGKVRKSTDLWLGTLKPTLVILWTYHTNMQLFQLLVGDG